MSMLSDIFSFFKALSKDISNLLDPYPKRNFRRRSNQEANENWTLKELGQAYEPWDFLSDEQWQEILRGEKPLEDFTTSHSWPPDKGEIEALAMKQENEQEQSEDLGNVESEGNPESFGELCEIDSTSELDSGPFETDAFESDFDSDSGGEGYIG